MVTLTVATWNTEWRKSASGDAAIIRGRLQAIEPDLVCLTETHVDFLESWGGYTVQSTDDWGGKTFGTRREVLLWSKHPWRDVDTLGSPDLPPGRFASAVIETSLGDVTFVGLVIPYDMWGVRYGARDRRRWEAHEIFLNALSGVTSNLPPNSIVLGDFNQKLENPRVPPAVRDKLLAALSEHAIVTGGELEPLGRDAIDHIALGSSLRAERAWSISNYEAGRRASDHFGVCATVCRADACVEPRYHTCTGQDLQAFPGSVG